MRLSLSMGADLNAAEGVWVEYDNDVSFKLRYASPEIIRKIRKGYTKKRWRRNEQIEIVNDDAFDTELWDKIIEAWKGITMSNTNTGKEEEAPCTKENKTKLIDISADHGNFILEKATDISTFTDVEQEDKEQKNL